MAGDLDPQSVDNVGDARDCLHEHLDLRYLLRAEEGALTPARGESRIVKWFEWKELAPLDLDPGLRRGLAKARRYLP